MCIQIDKIKVNPGRREALPEHIEELGKSTAEIGLLNPITIWCIVTLIFCCLTTTLLSSHCDRESISCYAPDHEESYTVGDFDQLQIWRIYCLGSTDDPALIPTKDFELNGWNYHMLRMDKDESENQTTYTAIFNGTKIR